MSKCILFSGHASTTMAGEICEIDKEIKRGEIYHHKFPSGEWYCQLKENVRGADVFLLQATSLPANDNLMQLLTMADAARRASAERITAVIPYMGYSRQDRKDKSRVPISAKLVMDLLQASGIDRVVTMDLHAAQIAGFTNLPFDHLYFQPSLARALRSKNIQVVVAPDIGAVKKATEMAERMNVDVAFIVKNRKTDTDVQVTQFVGDVENKNVLILDDLTESAGTLIAAAEQCSEHNAKNVFTAVTHGCLSSLGFSRIEVACREGIINQLYCSNTVTGTWTAHDSFFASIINVSSVFADAITNIHNNKSVSRLFT